MRVCVVGAGLAGSLLAWRLAADRTVRVDLVGSPGADATAVSGGVVRGFETLPEQRELAMDSLDELLASPVLRDWSGYRETGSTYLPVNLPADQLETAVKEIEAVCPGSAELTVAPDGWSGLAAGAVAVTERTAGRISPAALRAAVLADLADRITLRPGIATGIGPGRCNGHEYDVVVLATGAWTPGLLGSGSALRTKLIRYAVHEVSGWLPTCFVDETTGLYGAPGPDGLLLGVPTTEWDTDPSGAPAPNDPHPAAARATARFPRLRLGPVIRTAVAADCYTTPPMLALCTVDGSDGRLATFTGGSGGAAKTALAASRRAAAQLTHTRSPDWTKGNRP
jgi:glycine/D-amino acid oxidase-like deaminating enzyme